MITLNQSYTYEELLRNLQESGTQYPESTIYKKVGESHDERPIPMLRVGSGLDTLILTAGIHGKESINPVLLTRMAQEYCQAYQDNSYMGNYPVREFSTPVPSVFFPLSTRTVMSLPPKVSVPSAIPFSVRHVRCAVWTGPTGNTMPEQSILTGIFHVNPISSSSSANIPPASRKRKR